MSTSGLSIGAATDASIAAAVTTEGTDTFAALNATILDKIKTDSVPKWKATTAYLAGDAVLNPSGDVVTAIANFTSGASYSAANWNYSAAYPTTTRDTGDTFQSMNRRLNFVDIAGAKGSVINIDHRADGTGNVSNPGQTYGIDGHNYPGAVSFFTGHQYSNNGPFMWLDNTDDQPLIRMHNTQNTTLNPGKDGIGDFFEFQDHGVKIMHLTKDLVWKLDGGSKVFTILSTVGKALSVQAASTVNTTALEVVKAGTGAGDGVYLSNAGTGVGVHIVQTGAGKGLQIDANAAGNAGQYGALVQGYDYASSITTVADSGTTLTITKNGTGAGVVQQIVNKGTGNSLEVRSASAQTFTVAAGGFISVLQGVSVNVMAGTGSPEGVKSAPVGSLFLRTDGGAGTSHYVKESGAGNTGWVAK